MLQQIDRELASSRDKFYPDLIAKILTVAQQARSTMIAALNSHGGFSIPEMFPNIGRRDILVLNREGNRERGSARVLRCELDEKTIESNLRTSGPPHETKRKTE